MDRIIKEYFRLSLLLLLLLVACSREENTNEEPETPPVVTTAAPAAATRSVEPADTPTATPTAELPAPAISAENQTLGEDGLITISAVIVPESGWLVIYNNGAGSPSDSAASDSIIGYVHLDSGEYDSIEVDVDVLRATSDLVAALHQDAGETGQFEFPGPDTALTVDGETISVPFEVEIQAPVPAVSVADQEVTEDGIVVIGHVTSATPGWIVLHNDDNGVPGAVRGYAPVYSGENSAIPIAVNRFEATTTLHAVLYEDLGESEVFEAPEVDTPVTVGGEAVSASFTAYFPPDIFVLNQPVVDQKIVVERAVSYGPGWLVVYLEEEGSLGFIIGWAPLEDGVNELIEVELTQATTTPRLFLLLHQDTGDIGEFGFPGSDPAVLYQQRMPNPAVIDTEGASFLVTRDQQPQVPEEVIIDLAVTEVDAWLVIRAEEGGEAGEIVGTFWIPAGINRNVVVTVDPDRLTRVLFVDLHRDGGESGEFEFPDGPDIPLQSSGNIIRSTFTILPRSSE